MNEIKKNIINVEYDSGRFYDVSDGKEISAKALKSHSKTVEYRIKDYNDNLATAVAINQYRKPALSFLKDLENYNAKSSDIHEQIHVSNKVYLHEDIVATGLEILIDFTISDYEFSFISDQFKPVIDWWEKNLNRSDTEFNLHGLKQLLFELAAEFFVSGNVYPAESWRDVEIEGKEYRLPTQIALLNPLHVAVEQSALIGESRLAFSFTNINNDSLSIEDIFGNSPSSILNNNPLFTGNNVEFKQRTFSELNKEFVSHIKRKARSYDIYGIPYLTKLVQAVTYKQKLWQLDLNTIEGLLNMIMIFRVGSPDPNSKYHIPSQSRIQAFSDRIKHPQASTVLVAPHDIDVITAGPNGEILNFTDKYKEANRAIIQGLGVPPILIDGSGTATAAWVTILALNRRLDLARMTLKNYIEHILVKIARENDIELTGKEELTWFPSSLQNENLVKQLLLAFYDRGLLPIKTTHNLGGYRHADLLEIKEDELDQGLEDVFARPNIPFSPSPDKTPGRPSDQPSNMNPDSSPNTRSVKFAISGDVVADKYHDDMGRLLASLEDEIMDLKKRSKGPVDRVIEVAFVRMEQLADTYANFEKFEFDIEFASKLTLFHQQHINTLKDFVKSNINKLAIKKVGDEKDILISGIVAQARSRANLFVRESLRNIELARTLTGKKSEGFVGATVITPEDTKCEYCQDINGNFFTLSEIMEKFPAHPHQRYELEYSKTHPRGTKKGYKGKTVVQNPKNKSKKL